MLTPKIKRQAKKQLDDSLIRFLVGLVTFTPGLQNLFDRAGKVEPRNISAYAADILGEVQAYLDESAKRMSVRAAPVIGVGIAAGLDMAEKFAFSGITATGTGAEIGLRFFSRPQSYLSRILDYTSRDGWNDLLGRYERSVYEQVQRNILTFVAGKDRGPRRLADGVSKLLTETNTARTSSIMRTLELTAWRDTISEQYSLNAKLFTRQVRVASLDGRCCFPCIILHGTEMPIGARVADHFSGRCVSVVEVPGYPLDIETGEHWLRRQPVSEQKHYIQNPATFEQFRQGNIDVTRYAKIVPDPVFGDRLETNY